MSRQVKIGAQQGSEKEWERVGAERSIKECTPEESKTNSRGRGRSQEQRAVAAAAAAVGPLPPPLFFNVVELRMEDFPPDSESAAGKENNDINYQGIITE